MDNSPLPWWPPLAIYTKPTWWPCAAALALHSAIVLGSGFVWSKSSVSTWSTVSISFPTNLCTQSIEYSGTPLVNFSRTTNFNREIPGVSLYMVCLQSQPQVQLFFFLTPWNTFICISGNPSSTSALTTDHGVRPLPRINDTQRTQNTAFFYPFRCSSLPAIFLSL